MAHSSCVNAADALVATHAESHPHAVAAICDGQRITYASLDEAANRAGWALRTAGCKRGDRIIVSLPDSFEWLGVVLGALKIGAVAAPISTDARPEDLHRYVTEVSPALIVARESMLPALIPAATMPVAFIGHGDMPRPFLAWHQLLASAPIDQHSVVTRSDDPAVITYTSGSTGTQKAVVHTHNNVICGSRAVGQGVFGLTPGDLVLSTSRLSFSFGFGFGFCLPLFCGASTILEPERSQLEGCARLIARDAPSILCAVPSFLAALLQAARSWLKVEMSSLRFIASAGEPLPVGLYDGYRDHFGLEVLDGIGSTEMFSHFIANGPGASRRGSCGVAAPDCEVRLVDEFGREVPDGEVGSLDVRSGRAFVEYLNRAKPAGAEDGWVSTGDRLFRTAEGYFHFCGRDDDMLKVGGQWVSPIEVESVLSTHPKVQRVAVTVREDGRGGRRLVAYVVPAPGVTVAPVELLKHAESLPIHMIPSKFVIVPELPLTPNGKLNRGALPTPAWAEPGP